MHKHNQKSAEELDHGLSNLLQNSALPVNSDTQPIVTAHLKGLQELGWWPMDEGQDQHLLETFHSEPTIVVGTAECQLITCGSPNAVVDKEGISKQLPWSEEADRGRIQDRSNIASRNLQAERAKATNAVADDKRFAFKSKTKGQSRVEKDRRNFHITRGKTSTKATEHNDTHEQSLEPSQDVLLRDLLSDEILPPANLRDKPVGDVPQLRPASEGGYLSDHSRRSVDKVAQAKRGSSPSKTDDMRKCKKIHMQAQESHGNTKNRSEEGATHTSCEEILGLVGQIGNVIEKSVLSSEDPRALSTPMKKNEPLETQNKSGDPPEELTGAKAGNKSDLSTAQNTEMTAWMQEETENIIAKGVTISSEKLPSFRKTTELLARQVIIPLTEDFAMQHKNRVLSIPAGLHIGR